MCEQNIYFFFFQNVIYLFNVITIYLFIQTGKKTTNDCNRLPKQNQPNWTTLSLTSRPFWRVGVIMNPLYRGWKTEMALCSICVQQRHRTFIKGYRFATNKN